jgi:hypothetical protein
VWRRRLKFTTPSNGQYADDNKAWSVKKGACAALHEPEIRAAFIKITRALKTAARACVF